MAEFVSLAGVFAQVGNANAKAAFNERFRILQNAFIRDMNKRIGEFNEQSPLQRQKEDELRQQYEKLAADLPELERYAFDTETNSLRMKEITDSVTKLATGVADEGRDLFRRVRADVTFQDGGAANDDSITLADSGGLFRDPLVPGSEIKFRLADNPDHNKKFLVTSISEDGNTIFVTRPNGKDAGITDQTTPDSVLMDEQNKMVRLRNEAGELIRTPDGRPTRIQLTKITAATVEEFNKTRDNMVENLELLRQLSHPDYTDGGSMSYLKRSIETIKGLSMEAGYMDFSDSVTENASYIANRAAYNEITDLAININNYQLQTTIILASVRKYRGQIREKMQGAQAEVEYLDVEHKAEQATEIQKLRTRYATLLDAISHSYDAQSRLYDELAQSFLPRRPEKGTVVDMLS